MVVYVPQEISQYLLHSNNIWSTHFEAKKRQKKTLKDIFVYHFLFYICLFLAVELLK